MSLAIVTGGAGFIGSHLVDRLLANCEEVFVVDNLSTGKRENMHPDATFLELDICDNDALQEAFADKKVDSIYHLAAQPSVTVSTEEPHFDLEVNISGTLHVLALAESHQAPLLFASTAALYGPSATWPASEEHLPDPLTPYGASKGAAELYIRASRDTTGISHTVCRFANVYGPRQSPHGEGGVVAIFSDRIRRGEEVVLYGHGEPVRDYVYVDDIVDGILAAQGSGKTVNLSTGKTTTVRELYELFLEITEHPAPVVSKDLRPGEIEHSVLDPQKAEEQLGWQAQTPLLEGLRQTFDSFQEA